MIRELGAVGRAVFAASVQLNRYASGTQPGRKSWKLENFSVSLAVKDIQASKLFYEKLGFTAFAGDQSQNWLIMKNGDRYVGLFQGMFDKNILTFNPGWTSDAQPHLDLELAFPVKKMKGA